MFTTLNTCFFILALIYTLSGQLYLNPKIQNNNSNNTEEDINNESTKDNSSNGHWYDWLIKNIKTLSIGIFTLALFIVFNLMNSNGFIKKVVLYYFDSPMKIFMFSFNIIFIFYLTDITISNLVLLIMYFCYVIFKHYCSQKSGQHSLVEAIKEVFRSICPPPLDTSACVIYWILFSFIIINALLITLSQYQFVIYINTVMALCVLILIIIMISIVGDCIKLFGISEG